MTANKLGGFLMAIFALTSSASFATAQTTSTGGTGGGFFPCSDPESALCRSQD